LRQAGAPWAGFHRFGHTFDAPEARHPPPLTEPRPRPLSPTFTLTRYTHYDTYCLCADGRKTIECIHSCVTRR